MAFNRIKEEWIIWSIGVLALVVVITARTIHSDNLIEGVESVISSLSSWKNEIVSLALSYISGIIFYFFSSWLPYLKRLRIMQFDVLEEVRYFRDDFRDLSGVLAHGNWCEKIDGKDIAFQTIKQHSILKCNSFEFLPFLVDMFKEFITKFDYHIYALLNTYSDYLSEEELSTLIRIKRAHVLEEIRCHTKNSFPHYLPTNLDKFISELIEANHLVCELYTSLQKRYGVSK